jgi:hypothetical protein
MKQQINEHDQTKKMLDILRFGLIKEDEQEDKDTITPTSGDSTYTDELKKLQDTVTPNLQIKRFKIYPKDRDVQIDGRLDAGINFFMSAKVGKLMISVTDDQNQSIQVYLDDTLLTMIQKLVGYYQNWLDEWGIKLSNEYKSN